MFFAFCVAVKTRIFVKRVKKKRHFLLKVSTFFGSNLVTFNDGMAKKSSTGTACPMHVAAELKRKGIIW